MEYILETNNLTKIIGNREIVSSVNLHVKKGEIYGFLGPNGAGKTTVIKMITNLWKPTGGTISIFNKTLTGSSYEVLKRMGAIIEFPVFYDHLSAAENLKLHCEYMGYSSPGAVERALKLMDLQDTGDKPVKSFSLGMKERLGIARAVLTKPELVILDEPTNGLDPAGIKQIRDILKMLCREYGITIVISSHLLSEVQYLADTIGILSKGKLLREVSMKDVEDSNMAYIELSLQDVKKASYILSDKLKISNFKILEDNIIRIYDNGISTKDINKALALSDVAVDSIVKRTESLEDYFLKVTGEVERC